MFGSISRGRVACLYGRGHSTVVELLHLCTTFELKEPRFILQIRWRNSCLYPCQVRVGNTEQEETMVEHVNQLLVII